MSYLFLGYEVCIIGLLTVKGYGDLVFGSVPYIVLIVIELICDFSAIGRFKSIEKQEKKNENC